MSILTVTYPVTRREVNEPILFCPACGKQMKVFELWKEHRRRADRFEGATAQCQNCPTWFYDYDKHELKKAVHKIEKEKILAASWNERFEHWGDQIEQKVNKDTVDKLNKRPK